MAALPHSHGGGQAATRRSCPTSQAIKVTEVCDALVASGQWERRRRESRASVDTGAIVAAMLVREQAPTAQMRPRRRARWRARARRRSDRLAGPDERD